MRAGFILSGVGSAIRRNLSMTVALVLSSAIALGFLGGAILANNEIGEFKKTYEDKINVSVYLCAKNFVGRCTAETTPAQQRAIAAKLTADPAVSSYEYLDEQQVYERYKKTISPEIIKTGIYKVGVLPATFIVHLRDLRTDFTPFQREYGTLPGVGTVSDQSAAFKTLLDGIDSIRKGSLFIAIVILISSILLIANTVRVAAAQRKEETSIMRLVGASRWMTELPFILETVFSTILGAVLSYAGLLLVIRWVLGGVFGTQTSRGVIPDISGSAVLEASTYGLGLGIVLAIVTSFLTLRLRVKL
ncbi:MAG: permease-like cell division protein FtsX [Jatrophihabitans sp.]|uniref:permease-like cell division protein FtsX n=1 Tax=Jatrophihabitans sp. TaxID=1932789 RepID=UPI003F7FE983